MKAPVLPEDLRPELKGLLSPKGFITKAFCIKFLEYYPKHSDPEFQEHSRYVQNWGPGATGDGDQDLAETFALTGIWEEREGGAQSVWNAIELFKLS